MSCIPHDNKVKKQTMSCPECPPPAELVYRKGHRIGGGHQGVAGSSRKLYNGREYGCFLTPSSSMIPPPPHHVECAARHVA